MDKPTKPAGGDGSVSPWPEDSGSETSFGATGAFGVLKLPEEAEKPAPAPVFETEKEKTKLPSSKTGQLPTFGGKPLEEPVVHKVVFGNDDRSAELLDRIRMASAERPIFKEKTPAAQPGAQGSSGFTQLLRSLGGESPAPAPVAKQAPTSEANKPAPISGFTSLLQTLNAPDPKGVVATPPIKPLQSAIPPVPAEPPKAPPPSPIPAAQPPNVPPQVSFTEYLRATAGVSPAPSKPPAPSPRSGNTPSLAATPPPPPANAPGTFTQLFGTLGGAEASAPASAATPPPPANTPGTFTQLFGTLGNPEATSSTPSPASPPVRLSGPGEVPSASASPPQPAANTPGSFTQLFGTFGSAGAGASASGFEEMGLGAATPPPAENKPGEFTKLFGTFGNAETAVPAPLPVDREAAYPSGGNRAESGPGSFTRMLSLEQMSAPEPAFREERMPLPGAVDYGLTPEAVGAGKTGPATEGGDPFSQPLAELQPVSPSTPPSSGVGITQLIRMLDQPATPTAPPPPVTPANPAPGGPGIWTQTFASLSESSEPVAPAAAPSWAQPPVPPVVPATMNPPAAAGTPMGPSEFTRILDASRMREIAMKGGPSEGAAGVAQGQFGAGVPTVPMPGFSAPPMPPPTPMPAMKGMPQPGAFAPPPPPAAPAFPMNFTPPAVPQPPAVKPPAPPAGKLQQFVPLLLVLVIVLLVVLLVTVIFLMKH